MVDEPSNLADAVADAVDPDEVVGFTRSLIAARSENPGGTEDDAADVAVSILRGLGDQRRQHGGEAVSGRRHGSGILLERRLQRSGEIVRR